MEKSNQSTQKNGSESLATHSQQQKREDKTKETTSSESSAFAQVMSQMNIADLNTFELHYEKLWQQASEDKEALSVLICEIDYFKAYNAHYGHQAAAFMLLVVALELKKKSEQFGFFLARYKADKFVILIKGSDLKKVELIAESLRQNVEKSKTEHEFSKAKNIVTLSIGISYIYPTSMSMLMKEADSALSVAQVSGNKQVSLPLVLEEIKEKTDSSLDSVIASSPSNKPLNIKNSISQMPKESQKVSHLESSGQGKEKFSEEADMISRLQGVKPAPDKLASQQDNKGNEKADMLSRLKKMLPSADKLEFQKKDKLTEEVDMISQLKGITPSSGNTTPKEEEKLATRSQLDDIALDKLAKKQEEQSNYEELKAELEKLKHKSESGTPTPPVRYY